MKPVFFFALAFIFLSAPSFANESAPQEMQCQSSQECVITQSETGAPECSSTHSEAAKTNQWPTGKAVPPGGLKCGCMKAIGACAYAPPSSLK